MKCSKRWIKLPPSFQSELIAPWVYNNNVCITIQFLFQFVTLYYLFVCRACVHARLVTQSCLILCNPIDCSPPGFCPWDFAGKNTRVGCHFLLQGIFSGIELTSLAFPALTGGFFTTSTTFCVSPHPKFANSLQTGLYLNEL